MESNAIFNIKRFSGLFRTGIYRIKVSKWILMGFFVAFYSLFVFSAIMLDDVDKEKFRLFLIGLYQLCYIVTLTFASVRHAAKREKQMIWYMIAASTFEKRLFQTLRVLVWNTILFIVIFLLFDKILWFFINHGSIGTYTVGVKDLFSYGTTIIGAPDWLDYTASFFFMTLFPIISSSTIYSTSMSSEATHLKTYWLLYCIAMILQFFFLQETTINDNVGSFFKIFLSSISLVYLLTDLTLSAVKSCRND
jgi:hypothetical protein